MTANKPVEDNLQPLITTMLKVDSDPVGARVFVDNSYLGNTPLALDLPLGKHEIRLSLHDYYDWEAQLQLNHEGETPLNVQLIPMN